MGASFYTQPHYVPRMTVDPASEVMVAGTPGLATGLIIK